MDEGLQAQMAALVEAEEKKPIAKTGLDRITELLGQGNSKHRMADVAHRGKENDKSRRLRKEEKKSKRTNRKAEMASRTKRHKKSRSNK